MSAWFDNLKQGDEVAVVKRDGTATTAKVKKRTPSAGWVVLEDGRRFRPDQYSGKTIIELNPKIPYSERSKLMPVDDAKEQIERMRLAIKLEQHTLFWRSLPVEKLKAVCEIVFGEEVNQ